MKLDYVSKMKKHLAIGLIMCLTVLSIAPNADAKQTKKPKKIYLSVKTKKMLVGQKYKLKVKKVKPNKATKKVKWKSSNKHIATVSNSGVVKAKRAGTVKITAISKKNKKAKASCRIVVQPIKKRPTATKKPIVTKQPSVTEAPKASTQPVPTNAPTITPSPEPTGPAVKAAIGYAGKNWKDYRFGYQDGAVYITEDGTYTATYTVQNADTDIAVLTVDTNMKYNDVKDKMFGFVTEVKINDRSLELGEGWFDSDESGYYRFELRNPYDYVDDASETLGTQKITVNKGDVISVSFCFEGLKYIQLPSSSGQPEPTKNPGATTIPTVPPSSKPTVQPTVAPSAKPSSEPTASPTGPFKVKFVDYDNTVLKEETVEIGKAAVAPNVPKRIGYNFQSWDKAYDNVTEDLIVTAMYEKDMTSAIIVGDVKTFPGAKTVQVPVYINSNPGILGMTLGIDYNDKILTLTDASNGDALKDALVMTKANILKNNCKFTWDGESITKDNVKDGVMLLLTFDVSEEAAEGEYDIGFYYNSGDIVDGDLMPIDLELRNGTITIVKDAS